MVIGQRVNWHPILYSQKLCNYIFTMNYSNNPVFSVEESYFMGRENCNLEIKLHTVSRVERMSQLRWTVEPTLWNLLSAFLLTSCVVVPLLSFLTCNSWDGAMRGELKWRVEESAEGPQKWYVITPYYCCYESGPVKNVGLTEGSPLES